MHLLIYFLVFQESENPMVYLYLDFVPSLPGTSKINCLPQSKSWCEEINPYLPVQMIETPSAQYFLHEPVQLRLNNIVVPIYLYHIELVDCARYINTNIVPRLDMISMKIHIPATPHFNSDKLVSI